MEYRQWYESNRTWLCLHTPNLGDFMRHLRTAGLLDEDKQAEIEQCTGHLKKCECLYDHLVMFGVLRVGEIIHCLDESGQPHTAEKWRQYHSSSGTLKESRLPSLPNAAILPSSVWFETGEVVHNFTGREKELAALHKILTASSLPDSGALHIICIVGLGGIGKSTLARKYAFTYGSDYADNVVWIHAETEISARASFTRLATVLGIPIAADSTNEQITREVYGRFKNKQCLFIFDNVEDEEHFHVFKPKILTRSHTTPVLLITTRRRDLSFLPEFQLQLDVLTNAEASHFIVRHLPNSDEDDVQKLAQKLQRLPLALQQAVAYIRDKYILDNKCIVKYLDEFAVREKELLDDVRFKKSNDYSLTTFTVWTITLARIRELPGGETAIRVIELLSYLNPDHISNDFTSKLHSRDLEPELKLLNRFSMIDVLADKIAIHRLVQCVVRLNLTVQEEIIALRHIVRLLAVEFSAPKFSPFKRECMSHGLHLFPFQAKHVDIMKDRSAYPSHLSYFLIMYGSSKEALSIAEQSLSLFKQIYGEEHEATIRMSSRTADAHNKVGDPRAAMNILEPTLRLARAEFGDEHDLTMHILCEMAKVESELGNHARAVEIYDEIIPLRIRLHGEDDNVIVYKFQKAKALQNLDGQLEPALELCEEVHRVYLHRFGKNDLKTLVAMNICGRIAYKKGDLQKARYNWETVHEAYKHVLGETHFETIKVRESLEKVEEDLMGRDTCIAS